MQKTENYVNDAPEDMQTGEDYGSMSVEEYEPVNWLNLARDAHTNSTDYFDANIRKQIERNISMHRSKHPAGSKYKLPSYKYRSKLFRPKIRSTIRNHEAQGALALFGTTDIVNCKAEDPKDGDAVLGAKYGKNWLDYRLEHTVPWFQTALGAYQDAMVHGIVISRQEWMFEEVEEEVEEYEYGDDGLVNLDDRGKPVRNTVKRMRTIVDTPDIVLIPVENFRFSTAADWRDPIKSSPFLIEMIPMFVGDIKERMERPDKKTGEVAWRKVEISKGRATTETGEWDSTRIRRDGDHMDTKDEKYLESDFDTRWVHRNIIRKDGRDWVYYTLGIEHLLSEPVPLEDVFLHGRPYVAGKCIIETHRTYSSGLPEIGESLTVESNDLANSRLDNIKLIINKRYRGRRGANVDWRALTESVPGGVVLMENLKGDVEEESFSDVTGSSFEEQNRINADFDSLYGSFNAASVQTNRSLNETVGGMSMMLDDSDVVGEYQLRVFIETWAEKVLAQMLTMGRMYETDRRILGIVGGGDDPLDVARAMDTAYSTRVSVGFGNTSPQKRLENIKVGVGTIAELFPEDMRKLNRGEIIKEVFSALGHRDGGRFITIEDDEQQDPQMTALMDENAQLKQMIETKQAERQVDGDVKLQIAQMKDQGDTQRLMLKLQSDKGLADLRAQMDYIGHQLAAETNDIKRGELILQQNTLELQIRNREIDLLSKDRDKLSSVLLNNRYGMVAAAEDTEDGKKPEYEENDNA